MVKRTDVFGPGPKNLSLPPPLHCCGFFPEASLRSFSTSCKARRSEPMEKKGQTRVGVMFLGGGHVPNHRGTSNGPLCWWPGHRPPASREHPKSLARGKIEIDQSWLQGSDSSVPGAHQDPFSRRAGCGGHRPRDQGGTGRRAFYRMLGSGWRPFWEAAGLHMSKGFLVYAYPCNLITGVCNLQDVGSLLIGSLIEIVESLHLTQT